MFLISTLVLAQGTNPELTNYFPVSPNAASLGNFGAFPVNHNLGKVNIGVPIYSINTGKQELPISLNYNSGGIKLNDLASWVGLGWTLNSGGAIIRNTKGIPDKIRNESEIRSLENYEFNRSNYLYLYKVWSQEEDGQPDEFIINAPGVSGSFYFNPSDGLTVFNDHSKSKIEVISSSEIKVTRTDGNILSFGKDEAIEISNIPESANANDYDYISAWYLSEMIAPNKTDTISFKYKNKTSLSYPVATGESISRGGTLNGNYPNFTSTQKKYLERIEFLNGFVLFNSTTDVRPDLIDEYQLNNIKVYTGNYDQIETHQLINEFTLEYDQFVRSGGAIPTGHHGIQGGVGGINSDRMKNSRKYALKLNKLIIGNGGNEQEYKFEYNNTVLPLRGSTSQDFWGYPNTNTGSLLLPTKGSYLDYWPTTPINQTIYYDEGTGNREVNEQKMKAATLEKITYPTGGYTIFEYEANRYFGSVRQNNIIYKSAQVTAWGPSVNQSSDCGPSFQELTFTSLNYIVNSGKITVSFSQAQGREPTRVLLDGFQYNPTLLDPVSEIYDNQSYTVNQDLWGTHTIKAYELRNVHENNGAYDCAISSITAKWEETGGITIVDKEMLVGGLRIKSIKSYDAFSDIPASYKKFEYANENVLQPIKNESEVNFFFKAGNTYHRISTSLHYDNNIGSRPVIEYGNITEFDINTNNPNLKRKTIYSYNTVPSQRLLKNVEPTIYKHPQIALLSTLLGLYARVNNPDHFFYYKMDNWRFGNLKSKEIFKNIGTNLENYKRISWSQYFYDDIEELDINTNYVFNISRTTPEPDWVVLEPYNPNNPVSFNNFQFSYYSGSISTGKNALSQTITTNYDTNGENPIVSDNKLFL